MKDSTFWKRSVDTDTIKLAQAKPALKAAFESFDEYPEAKRFVALSAAMASYSDKHEELRETEFNLDMATRAEKP